MRCMRTCTTFHMRIFKCFSPKRRNAKGGIRDSQNASVHSPYMGHLILFTHLVSRVRPGFRFPQETHVIHQHVLQTSSNEGCECLPQGDDSIEITFSVGDGESRRFQLDFEPDLVEQPLHTYAPWGLSRRKLRLCLACRGGSFVKSSDWDSSE